MPTDTVVLERPTLPVLVRADAIVVGGSLAGVAAAIALAEAGRQVFLVESRTYLGRELTATLRPWLPADEPLPPLLARCAEGAPKTPHGELALRLDQVKLALEDELLAHGVGLLYASTPVAVCAASAGVSGVVVANKSGRQVLAANLVLDTTETALVARVAGAAFGRVTPGRDYYTRTLEFTGAGETPSHYLPVPPELGLAYDRVLVHDGHAGSGHVLVEYTVELTVQDFDLADRCRREAEARRRGVALAAWLTGEVAAFGGAWLAGSSYELHGPATSGLADPVPEWAAGRPLESLAGPLRGLWCLNGAARLPEEHLYRLVAPVSACELGSGIAQSLAARWPQVSASGDGPSLSGHSTCPRGSLAVREPSAPRPGRRYPQQAMAPQSLPVAGAVEVLVAGGGTSGATAAITAAGEGVSTLVIDQQPALGGTGTIGGVDSYWFGRPVAFAARNAARVAQVATVLHQPGARRWNLEAKQHALQSAAAEAGAEVWSRVTVFGAVMAGEHTVRGVVVATDYGPAALLGEVVIDATGDGDVAAFAGAETVTGSRADHLTMWYSLIGFPEPGRSANNFTSLVDVADIEDVTRAILAGRRRGGRCSDHGIMVAPRESRHVRGEATVTLTDQLRQRCWPDVVNRHFSNHDIKGQTTSPWLLAGLVPPNLEIELPYRALLPAGLDHLLVAGKAISVDHDGLPAVRMQADLENLGGVVGLAAAMAVRAQQCVRQVDVPALQARLVAAGLLPAEVIGRRLQPRCWDDGELPDLVAALVADGPLSAWQDMPMEAVHRGPIPFVEVCTAGPRIVPLLAAALATAPPARRVVLAQALAWYRSPLGVPVLVEAIERLLTGAKIPPRTTRIRHANLPPDQGAAPEAVYLLNSLGWVRDRRALPLWQRVVDLLDPQPDDFRDGALGTWCYVAAVCAGAERLGDPDAVPLLRQLHAYPTLRELVARAGCQPDFLLERRALLELLIARALARCGCAEGYRLLIDYLDDNRGLLAAQAETQLTRLSGRDFGQDGAVWSAWLAEAAPVLRPCPLVDDPDAAHEAPIQVAT